MMYMCAYKAIHDPHVSDNYVLNGMGGQITLGEMPEDWTFSTEISLNVKKKRG